MKISAVVLLVTALTMPMHATIDEGSWSTLHAGSNYGQLLEAGGAGDWILFLSQFGVGRVHRTGAQPAFSYFTDLGLKIPIYSYRLAIGDSVTFALYNGGYNRNDINIVKNNIVKTIRCQEIPRTLICEPAGTLWVGAEKALYRFDGSGWSRYAYNSADSIAATRTMVVDRNGSVFFSSGNRYIGHFNGTTVRRLNWNVAMEELEILKALFTGQNGNLLALTSSALYDIGMNGITTKIALFQHIYNDVKYCTLDSIGNLWFYQQADYHDKLVQFSIASGKPESIKIMSQYKGCPLFSNTSGICYYSEISHYGTPQGFVSLANSLNDSALIIYNQLPHNEKSDLNTGNIFHFKDGSIAYRIFNPNELGKNNSDSPKIIRYGALSCDTLPPLASFPRRLFEHLDGYLYAGTDDGLFRMKGALWEKLEGLSDIPIVNMAANNRGEIWGVGYDVFFHQTDRGWDIIDNSNSNLPEFSNGTANWYDHQENGVILVDSANTVWSLLDSAFVSTTDGHHWNIYTFSDLGLMQKSYGAGPFLYKNLEGRIAFVGRKDNYAMIRGTFTAGGIHLDTLSLPDSLGYTLRFIDCSGGIWSHRGHHDFPMGGLFGLSRYYNNRWFTYDSTNAPITWAIPYNEISPGKVQMTTELGEIVFNYSPSNAVKYPQTHFKQAPSGILSLSAFRKNITVNFHLSTNDQVSLSLFDVRGRLIKILDERKGMRGTFFRTFAINVAPGLYFVRLSTPDGSQVSRVILR